MTNAGLERLYQFQHNDGGWGWWENDESTPYMTAYVLLGLDTAANASVKIRDNAYSRDVDYLFQWLRSSNRRQAEFEDPQERALICCYVLSLKCSKLTEEKNPESFMIDEDSKTIRSLFDSVFRGRDKLNNLWTLPFGAVLHHRGENERAAAVLRGILETLEVDQAHATARVPTLSSQWWHWYNNDVETNACVLRAIVAIDPQNAGRRNWPTGSWPTAATATTGTARATRPWRCRRWPSICELRTRRRPISTSPSPWTAGRWRMPTSVGPRCSPPRLQGSGRQAAEAGASSNHVDQTETRTAVLFAGRARLQSVAAP